MAKKVVKKTKIKLLNILLVLVVIAGISYGVYYSFQIPIKNIIIKNTNYLNDDYIIELAGIKNYPSFLLTSSNKMKKEISSSKYIESVKISKKYGFKVVIEVEENDCLFFDLNKNKYVLENNEVISTDDLYTNFRVPRLLNYVPDTKYESFIKNMAKIDKSVLGKISDIEYKPNEYDKDRFLLYMDDGNMVYLTLTKFKAINHYIEVLAQLENHKGVLYLDNGNHFKIME